MFRQGVSTSRRRVLFSKPLPAAARSYAFGLLDPARENRPPSRAAPPPDERAALGGEEDGYGNENGYENGNDHEHTVPERAGRDAPPHARAGAAGRETTPMRWEAPLSRPRPYVLDPGRGRENPPPARARWDAAPLPPPPPDERGAFVGEESEYGNGNGNEYGAPAPREAPPHARTGAVDRETTPIQREPPPHEGRWAKERRKESAPRKAAPRRREEPQGPGRWSVELQRAGRWKAELREQEVQEQPRELEREREPVGGGGEMSGGNRFGSRCGDEMRCWRGRRRRRARRRFGGSIKRKRKTLQRQVNRKVDRNPALLPRRRRDGIRRILRLRCGSPMHGRRRYYRDRWRASIGRSRRNIDESRMLRLRYGNQTLGRRRYYRDRWKANYRKYATIQRRDSSPRSTETSRIGSKRTPRCGRTSNRCTNAAGALVTTIRSARRRWTASLSCGAPSPSRPQSTSSRSLSRRAMCRAVMYVYQSLSTPFIRS
ncbi:hypothetical protein B0H17DRAFT_1066567 [Mycena rosella]|uniref:Uncharacterized protein n=1 Tax=Mycena rosella TaxID=1033263 RepID=A0AAD7DE03_MYCRO|nr:hypothetical protein B0H17DRAFT_1066567 [Mycena rosella]